MTDGSKKTLRMPSWMLRAMLPSIARQFAKKLRKDHPDESTEALLERLRADAAASAVPEAAQLVAAVERHLQPRPAAGALLGEVARTPSAILLVLANLVPLYGVVFLDWPVVAVLVLFWIENVIVGVLNVARMICADPGDAAQWAAKLFMVPFFCVHYGMFTGVHGAFVFGFFGTVKRSAGDASLFPLASWLEAIGNWGLWPAAAVLAASHLFSFFWNYLLRGEYRTATVGELMGKPYGRVVVLHVTILFGGFGVIALGSPVWALVLLVALKTGIDLFAHLREHRAAARDR